MTRGLVVTALSLAVLILGGCTERSQPSGVATDSAPQPTTNASAAGDYCKLYAGLEEKFEGNPYDPETYAAMVRHMQRAAAAGPAELSDEWAVVIADLEAVGAATSELDLAGLSETEVYMITLATMGQGPWPPGVDRRAFKEFDRTLSALDHEGAGEADDTISETTRELCGDRE